ncbi:dihydropteroate synthase [Zavarzinia sp. CC-PAN008]|uniref:dihydropteroate synthase n=1 Tax=Zavarzinia sp. CC-PAN008 TaxID=3243332 RepID=UPI003F7470DC
MRLVKPLGLVAGAEARGLLTAGLARPLGTTGLAFTHVELAERHGPGRAVRSQHAVTTVDPANLAPLVQGPVGDCFSDLGLPARPLVMAILNVTPDSFSDGGRHASAQAALAHAQALIAAGADVIDVGGESTRPFSQGVADQEEIDRVLPVIEGLRHLPVIVSVDTRKPAVMRAAVAAGAHIVNDVSALTFAPESVATAANLGVPVILMHHQGSPATMQVDPRYDDVVPDVVAWLAGRIAACEAAGIPRARLCVDPGIGFGKTMAHNLSLIEDLAALHMLRCPILLGTSRKGFLGRLGAGGAAADERLGGSLASALAGVARGARIVRVHDVAETAQALALVRALHEGRES